MIPSTRRKRMLLYDHRLSQIMSMTTILLVHLLIGNHYDDHVSLVVNGLPYMLLTHSGTKCLTVHSLPRTNLKLKYHAPDMVLLEEMNQKENESPDSVQPEKQVEDTLDRISKSRRKAEMKDMSIVISVRSTTKISFKDETKPATADTTTTTTTIGKQQIIPNVREPPRQMRSNLVQRNGTLDFYTGDVGGPIDICIRSLYASRTSPSRFSLLIEDELLSEDDLPMNEKLRLQQRELQQKAEREQQIQNQFSSFDSELQTIEKLITKFQLEADQLKPQEHEFFQKTLAMQKSNQFWSIVQMIIVILGGIVQAKIIVQFFQSRHLY